MHLKVKQFRKDFLVSSNSPKKQTNEFAVVVKTNLFVRFLGEFKDTKSPFEMIWPLQLNENFKGLFFGRYGDAYQILKLWVEITVPKLFLAP